MGFNPLNDKNNAQELSEINMIPLIDVMLVLLILFMITAPFLSPHAFQIQVPKAETESIQAEPEIISLAINAQGHLFLGDDKLNETTLLQRLSQSAQQKPQPVIHLRADANIPYQRIADVLAVVKKSGIEQLGFITQAD